MAAPGDEQEGAYRIDSDTLVRQDNHRLMKINVTFQTVEAIRTIVCCRIFYGIIIINKINN